MTTDNGSVLEKLRTLDESIKLKVMMITTILVMMLVVCLWVVYFNAIVVPGSVSPDVAPTSTTVSVANSSPGISDLFSSAMSSFWDSMKNTGQSFGEIVQNPKQYNVSPN